MSKTINLQAAVLAVVATLVTFSSVHAVAAYEQRSAVAAAESQRLFAAASPAVQQAVGSHHAAA